MSISLETDQIVHEPSVEARPVGPVIEMAQTVIEEQQAEIDQLKERLSYYQAFDALINDNIKRSAELFRTIYEERERGRRNVMEARAEIQAAATLEIERRIDRERQSLQATLGGLLEEAGYLQRQIDSWVEKIAGAIHETGTRPHDEWNPETPPRSDA